MTARIHSPDPDLVEDSDTDFADDMREAHFERMELERKDMQDMEEADEENREKIEEEIKRAVESGELDEELHRFDNEWISDHALPISDTLSRTVHTKGCHYCAEYDHKSGLGPWLAHMAGHPFFRFDESELHTVSRSAALLDTEGRRSLGMYSLLGDAAATYAVVQKCFRMGFSKSRASEARTRCTNWNAMARVFAGSVPKGLVQFPADIDPGSTRSGGEALEALFGLVSDRLGTTASSELAASIGLFKSYDFKSDRS